MITKFEGTDAVSRENFNARIDEMNTELGGKSDTGHTHNYALSAHTHTIANITSLQTTLNAKLPLTGGNITGNLTVASKQVYHTGNITVSTVAPTAVLAEGAQHQTY